jgi:hypothetical protein
MRTLRDIVIYALLIVVVTTVVRGFDLCWLMFWAGGGC